MQKGDEEGCGHDQCSICMVQFEEDEEATYLPCEHHFHFSCIEEWFSRQNTCPICRSEMPTADDPFDVDSVGSSIAEPELEEHTSEVDDVTDAGGKKRSMIAKREKRARIPTPSSRLGAQRLPYPPPAISFPRA